MVVKKGKSEHIFQAVIIFVCCAIALVCLLPLLSVLATSLSSPGMILRGQVLFWPKEFTTDAVSYTHLTLPTIYSV